MTREEAIQVLRDWDGCFIGHRSDDVNEALNMAIKALEQAPKLQNRCYALTQGQMCMFCSYDCERRTTAKREVME